MFNTKRNSIIVTVIIMAAVGPVFVGIEEQVNAFKPKVIAPANASSVETFPMEKTNATFQASKGRVEIATGSSQENNGKYFVPEVTQIHKGSAAVWTNKDETLHTVTSGIPGSGSIGTEFDSNYMETGKTFEHTFKEAGTYDYFCTLHPFMTGQIIVK